MTRPEFDYFFSRYGLNTHAHLIAYADVEYFQARHVEGLVGYFRVPGLMVALGDPLCDPAHYPAVLDEFLAAAQRAQAVPCSILNSPALRTVAEARGMWALKIGEQFIFDLASYRPRGNAAKKVRSAANKARRLGVTVREMHPTGEPDDPESQAIRWVAERWIGGKRATADLFLLGLHLFESRQHKRYFGAFLDGVPQAVLICSPIPCRQGILFEDMVRLRDARVSPSELLVLSALEALRAEGLKMATFGCQPYVDTRNPPAPFTARVALGAFMPLVNMALPLARIYHYHHKYATSEKEDVYLLSPRHFPFFRIILGVFSTCNFKLFHRDGLGPNAA